MNRENKRKTFEKGYYKTHACNDSFTCKVCGRLCTPQNAGSDHRNHCPNCLSSLHVDLEPGDRASDCGGIMDPVAVWVRKGGEWAIIHRCRRCGALSSNRVAADDILKFTFSRAATRENLDGYEAKNAFQQRIKDAISAGEIFYETKGIIDRARYENR